MFKSLIVIAALAATPVLADGAKEFKKCASCHSIDEGAVHAICNAVMWQYHGR